MAAYGTPQPPDVAADYAFLRETPVDLVAGLRDGVIPPHNVRLHFARMKAAGVQVRAIASLTDHGCSSVAYDVIVTPWWGCSWKCALGNLTQVKIP